MKAFVYFGGERIEFEVPPGWHVLYGKEIEPSEPSQDFARVLFQ